MTRDAFKRTQRAALPAAYRDGAESHPAYGQIMVFKTSGFSALYGSDHPHQHYVSIEIHESELRRDYSRDWPSSRKELIRISMSEAQFASMVASAGRGEGTQCTIVRKMVGENMRLESMPDIALKDRTKLFEMEGRAKLASAIDAIDVLILEMSEEMKGMSAKRREAVLAKLQRAKDQIGPNLQFVGDQFAEHLEEAEEKAKTEVTAWIDATIRRSGVAALLGEDETDPIELMPPDDGEDQGDTP